LHPSKNNIAAGISTALNLLIFMTVPPVFGLPSAEKDNAQGRAVQDNARNREQD